MIIADLRLAILRKQFAEAVRTELPAYWAACIVLPSMAISMRLRGP